MGHHLGRCLGLSWLFEPSLGDGKRVSGPESAGMTVNFEVQVRYHVLTEPEMKPLLDEINQQIQKEKDEES